MSVPLLIPPSTISKGSFPICFLIGSICFSVGTAVSSCLPPWLEIIIPSAPWFSAFWASSGLRIPFTKTGSSDTSLIHWIISKVNVGSNKWSECIDIDEPSKFSILLKFSNFVPIKFPSFKLSGILNELLSSLSLVPNLGASTVKTIAL